MEYSTLALGINDSLRWKKQSQWNLISPTMKIKLSLIAASVFIWAYLKLSNIFLFFFLSENKKKAIMKRLRKKFLSRTGTVDYHTESVAR
jgi:hypothetical protein